MCMCFIVCNVFILFIANCGVPALKCANIIAALRSITPCNASTPTNVHHEQTAD